MYIMWNVSASDPVLHHEPYKSNIEKIVATFSFQVIIDCLNIQREKGTHGYNTTGSFPGHYVLHHSFASWRVHLPTINI